MAETQDNQIKAIDRELEARASGAMRDLMEHRWHWTLNESNPERMGVTAYARLVNRDHAAISKSAHGYALLMDGDQLITSPAEAYALAGLGKDMRASVSAIAERDSLTIGSARQGRYPEAKAIAAEIADLPDEDKEKVSRELARDPGFMSGALAEHAAEEQKRSTQRAAASRHEPAGRMSSTIDLVGLRMAVSKVEEAARAIDSDHVDESAQQSIATQAQRLRTLADYLEALIGMGDMDKALEELLS